MCESLADKLMVHVPLSRASGAPTLATVGVVNHNVEIGERSALFNGRDAALEVRRYPELLLEAVDFSIAVQVWTDAEYDGIVGDIVSKFDPIKRRGLNLSIKSHAGAVTSQTNSRNLHFEIDDATDVCWYNYGRPGSAVAVWALAVHEGKLFAGTYEQGADESGGVFCYSHDQSWQRLGPLDGSNAVSALAEFGGHLYAATRTEDPHGSLLAATGNNAPGGNVFRLNADDCWTHCGRVCEEDNIFGLAVFEGQLFAWPAYAKGVYRYAGGEKWERITSPDSRLFALAPYHGSLYATANRLARLDPNAIHAGPDGDPSVQAVVGKDGAFRLNPDGTWTDCGNQAAETQIYSIGIHAGRMYVGTWPSGKVFRYEGDRQWTDCGRLGEEDEVMGLAIYNGMLYAGGLPSASIYRYDNDHRWTRVGRVDHTPNVPLRRAINMAVHQGRLCVGTLPSGHVWAMEVGQVASHDRAFPTGWHSIAAIRQKGTLVLYVDGKVVARSRAVDRSLNLDCNSPLCIGRGRHDSFNGRMRDLRIYGRALSDSEIGLLAAQG
jgi:hypothetical protein